jgi:hypothetical protein
MKGFFKIILTGEDSNLPRNSSKRTGEQRLALVEKTLRKDGIEFVEDFDGDSVIVRYGDFVDDALWDAECARQRKATEPATESEEVYA